MKSKISIKEMLSLFITFFKIGAFTFGGGYAMIPLIQRETVDKKNWISSDDILEIVAIAESTPGPIAINAATFVGMRVGGVIGAIFATLGVILPSFTIISVIAVFLREFSHIRAIKYAFAGIRIGVLALILGALISMIKKASVSVFFYLLALLAFTLVTFFKTDSIIVIIICAIIGLIFGLFQGKRRDKHDPS